MLCWRWIAGTPRPRCVESTSPLAPRFARVAARDMLCLRGQLDRARRRRHAAATVGRGTGHRRGRPALPLPRTCRSIGAWKGIPRRDRGRAAAPLHDLLPGRARGGGRRPALRRLRAHERPGPAPEAALRHRDGDQGPGAAPAQDGVRLPHAARPPARSEFATPAGGAGGVGDADRRPERGGRRVDRAVPHPRPEGLPLPRPRRARDLPLHVGGRRAPGRGRPQRRRGDHHRPRGDRARRPRRSCSGSATSTASASRSSSSCCRT